MAQNGKKWMAADPIGKKWIRGGLLLGHFVKERLAMEVDLFGSFPCTIENGRIKLPAPFCKTLSIESKQTFHITKEDIDSLYLYSPGMWENRVDGLKKLRMKEGGEKRLRSIADTHYLVDVDKNGRMTIPQDLREAAGLDKRVVVVGLFDHMEIWDYGRYERSQGRM